MDVLLAICGIVNCIVVFKLGKYAYEAFTDYVKQMRAGSRSLCSTKVHSQIPRA